MKIKFTFLLLMLAAFILPHAVYAETAQPATASVTVNGETVNFCAYNIYGSNYFMLREVAMALASTEKAFDVDWNSGFSYILLSDISDYEATGLEFTQSGSGEKEAVFSVPSVKRRNGEMHSEHGKGLQYVDRSLTLVGYNIEDSNYFKIRDLARIFDFYIGYEDGCITIDTSKTYEPEMPYEPDGKCIGIAHEARLALFINEMPIVSYYSAVDTAYNETQLERLRTVPRLNGVYVSATDLENYGFDKTEDSGNIYLTRNTDKEFAMLDGEIINSAPSDVREVYASDTAVYLDGAEVRNISVGGKPYISAAELLKYGDAADVSYDYSLFDYGYPNERVNIDFMTRELEDRLDTSETQSYMYDSDENKSIMHRLVPLVSFGFRNTLTYSGELIKYNSTDGQGSIYTYIGCGGVNDAGAWVKNGKGLYHYRCTSSMRMEARRWSIDIGEYKDDEFIDGISLESGSYGGGITHGTRTDGARINGYKRESVFAYWRFGYRVVCEGTIENGEYCGYYRQYDDNGKLIFEGEYSDYIKD